jgi:biopolymer transport protein ExbD
MTVSKSFVDILFILLCATIVLLSQSLQVGAVKTAPAEVGGGAISPVKADEVRAVVVNQKDLLIDGVSVGVQGLKGKLESHECALLVPGDEGLSHHRMMKVWSDLRAMDVTVKLAAVETEPATNFGGREGSR